MAGVADKNAFKAGLFILISLGLGLAVFFAVQGFGWRPAHGWTVRFNLSDDVSGVGPGAEVRLGGVKAGTVEAVTLSDDLTHVDVRIELPGHVRLRQNPRVAIQATVTGVAWLNFDSLGEGEPLPPGSVIAGEAGTFSNLVAAANRLAPAVTGLVDDVRHTTVPKVNDVLTKTGGTLDKVDQVADRANSAAGTVDEMLKANRQALEQTLANLREATDKAPQLVADAQKLVGRWTDVADNVRETLDGTGQRLDELLDTAQAFAGDMKEAGSDTAATMKDVRALIGGNRGKIELIVNRLRDTSAQLSLASAEIRRSPWRLLYRPDGEQRESLDLYDAARRFAEGANALQDASVALSDAANDPTADPERVRQLLDDLQRKFEEFGRIEQALYERLGE